MRRIAIIAAAAMTLLPAFAAEAREDRGRGRGRGDERRVERQDERSSERSYDRRSNRGPRYEPRPEVRRREDPRNAPPPYYSGRNSAWRQGQRLPPAYRGDVLRDPGRFRLRAAPPGYDWVGVGPDIYLVQRSTGMVLDTIPGGY